MDLRPSKNHAFQKLTIKEIVKEAPGVRTFIFENNEQIPYHAGQFLTFVFEGISGEERRSYSICSSPDLKEPLSVSFKRVPNGKISRFLTDKIRKGDVLSVTGAAGQFVLPENISGYQQLFFFAAGIGITPVFSLIKTLLVKHPSIEVILIYSNTSPKTTVFYKELLELKKKHPGQFKLEFLFSSSPDLSKARLSKWLLPQLLEIYPNSDKSKQLFYTCGPFPYMRMVTITLIAEGYTAEQIKKENFDTQRPAFKIEPPDKEPHQVVLKADGKEFHFSCQYPQTILQAAKAQNIVLPYSCETGRCGSCILHCTSGKVWMSYNEVLTEKEIASGKVLTCTGYPIGGNVVLESE